VHRSICPENLVVDRAGVVKIIDLGLVRISCPDEALPTLQYHDEAVLGPPDYIAPEQVMNSDNVDVRADIYALGCTFYFLLSGNPPFVEGTLAHKLIWHQTRQPQPISDFRTDVPEGMIAVLNRMMAKSPEARFQDPQEIADALAIYVDCPIPPPDTGRHF
jgi:serine/threonine protein kinase